MRPNSSLECRKNEICDTFDYLKQIALDTVTNKMVLKMYFTIDFSVDSAPTLSYDISEVNPFHTPPTIGGSEE